MIIYAETKGRFLEDVDRNRLKDRLEDGFRRHTGGVPADRDVWADEYARFSGALRRAHVDDDIGVAIEYHVRGAGRSRVDVLLAGNDGQHDHGLVLELKAWSSAGLTDIPELVWSPYGGGSNAQHPCVQARKYKLMIEQFNADVGEKGIRIESAAYLFNLKRRSPEPLEDARYRPILDESRLFLADDTDALAEYLGRHVRHKPRHDVFHVLESGRLAPTPALIERVHAMLDGNPEFELLDAQNEAFQVIRHAISTKPTSLKRRVFIVHGGPGTGKSVIAVRLLAEVLKLERMGFFVAPNKAFRDTLVEHLTRGNPRHKAYGKNLFKSSWSFDSRDFDKDRELDVLIVDEAHRLKDQAYQYKGESMVEDMVRAARISVFFLDEAQRVQWNDTGSEQRIRDAALKFHAQVEAPMRLTAQFRCGGSDGYLNWLDDVLQVQATGNYDNWADEQYRFEVFDRAEDLHAELQRLNGDNKARLIAGYAWEWPTEGRARQGHAKHVRVDGLALPWNFDGENWATSEDGIQQVGCVHTAQGIEFDWLGVLVGDDLRYEDGKIVGDPARRARTDSSLKGWKKALDEARGDAAAEEAVHAKVQAIIKNTYKVLMSRGRKGCFVWCADPALREYLRERLALARRTLQQQAPPTVPAVPALQRVRVEPQPLGVRYREWLPVYSLQAAAGGFGPASEAGCEGWVAIPAGLRADERCFVAKVVGRSMEPGIPDGAYCVFRRDVAGTKQGKVVLVQHRAISDPETGGSYTVKEWRSVKVEDPDAGEDASLEHVAVKLLPRNKEFKPIWIAPDAVAEVRVVAELVRVIGS